MIVYAENSDLLNAPPDHYKVITVNTVGVMGKGLAKSASLKFPQLLDRYKYELKNGLDVYKPKLVHVDEHKFILFATKLNWRNSSQIDWIENGMIDLVKQINFLEPMTIHMPKLGCGLGGLLWANVHDVILDKFKEANERHNLVLYV